MKLSFVIFCTISWLLATYSAGIFVFIKGFLLKRQVMDHRFSTCEFPGVESSVSRSSNVIQDDGCWMSRRFSKTVLVIIDALRFDFTEHDPSVDDANSSHFKNKLKFMNSILNEKPENARLYKFIADPPTTTLQRLKGLTTGSLPTFVDAGSNFDSSEINEDNFITQLFRQQRNVVFMGDDTWMSLFPKYFKRSFPFPSFNVKDLHTVDNGVLSHLSPELQKDDWSLLIAHFLGVDHCGHRYGPDHPAMAEKLTQMDNVLRYHFRAFCHL